MDIAHRPGGLGGKDGGVSAAAAAAAAAAAVSNSNPGSSLVRCGRCGGELSSRCLMATCHPSMVTQGSGVAAAGGGGGVGGSKSLINRQTACRICGGELATKCILAMCSPK